MSGDPGSAFGVAYWAWPMQVGVAAPSALRRGLNAVGLACVIAERAAGERAEA